MVRESLVLAGSGIAMFAVYAAAAQACGWTILPLNALAMCWTCAVSSLGSYLAMRTRERWEIVVVLLVIVLGLAGRSRPLSRSSPSRTSPRERLPSLPRPRRPRQ